MITIELIVAFVLLAVQFLLAVVGAWHWLRMGRRYQVPLTSMVSIAELLEKYVRIHEQIDIKVDAPINRPARAGKSILLVKRELVYDKFIYGGVFTVYQILLMKAEHGFLRRLKLFQMVIFGIEVVFIILGTVYGWLFYLGAIVIAGALVILSLVASSLMNDLLIETFEIAKDLLELDQIESDLAEQMIDSLRSEVYVYPLVPLLKILNFIVPGERFRIELF